MKIDRILEIIIYLLNHDNVTASYLARRFEVSVRTIQRDMICISNIGIPVYALSGKNGGYSIMKNYKIKNMNIFNNEQQLIINALESLATSYSSDALNSLIEKYNTIIEKEGGQKIFWDFSITKENYKVQNLNTILEEAIDNRNYVSFDYKNAQGERSKQYIEPLAIHYKWYAWYLFSYSKNQNKYKTFKIARINNLSIEKEISITKHEDVKILMKTSEQEYYDTCISVEVEFSNDEYELIEEYFPDCPIEKISVNLYRVIIRVPAKERLWKALLLSFGNRVKVISPESYKIELIETAQKFLSNYDI
ncbi:helix-turn-helix transcriptional regulator [Peptostreptococcus canis]|uniref:YafY family transcriptional regulator n=1 Tax=Peptostreptococcus canis TaxID=1159213 RepID=A0ABR6TJH5_9FIRM|nr:YafY family protein [Peptostreptococcus canis]MBC2575571.1 YafY family transcriptional regulator [Peptostreptococcus canis]MBP1997230.1 putative DNA-binding transcriptional regulator YafY [Peptostreptococcus canis]